MYAEGEGRTSLEAYFGKKFSYIGGQKLTGKRESRKTQRKPENVKMGKSAGGRRGVESRNKVLNYIIYIYSYKRYSFCPLTYLPLIAPYRPFLLRRLILRIPAIRVRKPLLNYRGGLARWIAFTTQSLCRWSYWTRLINRAGRPPVSTGSTVIKLSSAKSSRIDFRSLGGSESFFFDSADQYIPESGIDFKNLRQLS
jgi:hypothetical protein